MADISLSKAVRTNLMSLQTTATMMSKTQERLATGNKVNSALDNPTNYFTASGLNNRASDLSNLLDTMSNSIKTIEAADKGIKAIEKLVKSAQSTVNQALQDGKGSTGTQIQSNSAIDTTGVTGVSTKDRAENQTLAGLGFAAGDEISLTSTDKNGTTSNVTITVGTGAGELDTTAKVSDLLAKINASGVASAEITEDGRLNLTATGNKSLALSIEDAGRTETAAQPDQDGSAALTDAATGDNPFLALGFLGIQDKTGTDNGDTTDDGNSVDDVLDPGGYDVNLDFNATAGSTATLSITSTAAATQVDRSELKEQFNAILVQIDDLAKDSSFNGVNLIASNTTELKIAFNERRDEGKSEMTIKSKDLTSEGLGLNPAGSLNDTEANQMLDKLTDSLTTLRSAASSFGSQLSTVQTREDFTKEMVDTLESGAGNLTLADMNKEAANLLALQTRQQLSSSALSMASQADQSVLQLLR